VSIVYNCCWSSPAHSISDPNPAGLMTIFYCLRFETPNLEGQVPAYISGRNRGPSYTPSHGFPFRRLLRLAGLRWRYSSPPPHVKVSYFTLLSVLAVLIVRRVADKSLAFLFSIFLFSYLQHNQNNFSWMG
jgi:hypothetical protein